MIHVVALTLALSLALGTSVARPVSASDCHADCNRDCVVTVDEVIAIVGIALGQGAIAVCPGADADGDGRVTVDEIVASVDAALVGCNGTACGKTEARCVPAAGVEVAFDPKQPACEWLSSYRFFIGEPRQQRPNARVVPYDLNTELFADGTVKHRFVWLPPGTMADYHDRDSFAFPIGTVLIKTFALPFDERDSSLGADLLETRLLVRREDGWFGWPYVWDEAEGDARLAITGARLAVSGIDHDGIPFETLYEVPNVNQCKSCHDFDATGSRPLGPRARNLNMDEFDGVAVTNQLVRWANLGLLRGLPDRLDEIPRAAVLDDPTSGTIEERARSYLDVNCAHCHNATGAARPTGVHLDVFESDPLRLGVCKNPTAAAQGTGGRPHILDPGRPDNSVLIFRVESTDPILRMPELGRSRVDAKAVAVLRDWVAGLEGECVFPGDDTQARSVDAGADAP